MIGLPSPKREEFPTFCTARSRLGYDESKGHRRKEDGQGPENKKTIVEQAFHPGTARASALSKLAADLHGIHVLIADVSFHPEHADDHTPEHHQPK